MIINVRGTSGSGKSTLVRAVMSRYSSRTPVVQEGRRQPIGYSLSYPGRSLFVPGHYETACGGCDTISEMERIFDIVRERAHVDYDVLMEGLLISGDFKRTSLLLRDFPGQVHVVHLDVPMETCAAGVGERRAARGAEKPLGPNFQKNLLSKHRAASTSCARLREAGADVFQGDREACLARVLGLLGLPS